MVESKRRFTFPGAFSLLASETHSRLFSNQDLKLEKEDQNSPKSGSAQPSGSNSGGCSNQRVNGWTNTSSASSKGRHSIAG